MSIDNIVATYIAHAKVRALYTKQTCISNVNRKTFIKAYDEALEAIEDAFCDRLDEMGVPMVSLMENSSGFVFRQL